MSGDAGNRLGFGSRHLSEQGAQILRGETRAEMDQRRRRCPQRRRHEGPHDEPPDAAPVVVQGNDPVGRAREARAEQVALVAAVARLDRADRRGAGPVTLYRCVEAGT